MWLKINQYWTGLKYVRYSVTQVKTQLHKLLFGTTVFCYLLDGSTNQEFNKWLWFVHIIFSTYEIIHQPFFTHGFLSNWKWSQGKTGGGTYFQVSVIPGNTNWRERLGTDNLLLNIICPSTKVNNNFGSKMSSYNLIITRRSIVLSLPMFGYACWTFITLVILHDYYHRDLW